MSRSWRAVPPAGARRTAPAGYEAIVLALGAAGCLAAGWRLGYWEVVAVGSALALSLAAAGVHVLGHPRIDVIRPPGAVRTIEGEPASVTLTVVNRGRRRRPPTVLVDGTRHDPVELRLPPLPAGGERTVTVRLPALARGRYEIGPTRILRSDPLGLLVRAARCGSGQPMWVHPRTGPSPGASRVTGAVHRAGTAIVGRRTPDTVRPLRPGDDARAVHWPSSVRRDDRLEHLMVRDRVAEGDLVVVYLDTAPSSYPGAGGRHADSEAFDAAVRAAASVVVAALLGGRAVELHLTGGRVHRFGAGRAGAVDALDRLAEARISTPSSAVAAAEPAPGAAVLVTGPGGEVPAPARGRSWPLVVRAPAAVAVPVRSWAGRAPR